MTKHLPDEAKICLSSEEADKILSGNLEFPADQELGVCGTLSRIESMREAVAKSTDLKVTTKTCLPKSEERKIMPKLYNLESDDAKEKPLNIDLCVDLYQMEKH